MTVYDDMRGYIHAHDRNGWFDVTTETTPMYQMVDKADAENAKLRELCKAWYKFAYELFDECFGEPELNEDFMTLEDRLRELGVGVD